jgi:hypothetical protein
MKFWLLIQRAFEKYGPLKFVITHNRDGMWYVAMVKGNLKRVGPLFKHPQDVHKFLEMMEHGSEATFDSTGDKP